MTTEVERLEIPVEVDGSGVKPGMDQAAQAVDAGATKIAGSVQSMASQVGSAFKDFGSAVLSSKEILGGLSEFAGRFGQDMQAAGGAVGAFSGLVTAAVTGSGGMSALYDVLKTSVVAAADFGSQMNNVASLLPGQTARVGELSDSVRALSVETGKGTTDITGGLYQVISAFGDSADTAKILEINVKAAAAGLSTTTQAIDLTSAVTKSYGDTSANAVEQVADLAFQTVRLGQTNFPELAASIGRVTPLAAQLGVSTRELFATFATFTGVTGKAAEVSTQFRGALQAFMAPTDEMGELIKKLGYENGEAMVKALGFQGSLKAVTDEATASGVPLQKYIGSIEGQALAYSAASGQAATFTEKQKEMGEAAGASSQAYSDQQGAVSRLNAEWNKFTAGLADVALSIGKYLEEPLADVLVVAQEVVSALKWILTSPNVIRNIPLVGGALAAITGDTGLPVPAHATGGVADTPQMGIFGEAGKEYWIPVENNKDRGLALWKQAGHDLGVPMMAEGGWSGQPRPIYGGQPFGSPEGQAEAFRKLNQILAAFEGAIGSATAIGTKQVDNRTSLSGPNMYQPFGGNTNAWVAAQEKLAQVLNGFKGSRSSASASGDTSGLDPGIAATLRSIAMEGLRDSLKEATKQIEAGNDDGSFDAIKDQIAAITKASFSGAKASGQGEFDMLDNRDNSLSNVEGRDPTAFDKLGEDLSNIFGPDPIGDALDKVIAEDRANMWNGFQGIQEGLDSLSSSIDGSIPLGGMDRIGQLSLAAQGLGSAQDQQDAALMSAKFTVQYDASATWDEIIHSMVGTAPLPADVLKQLFPHLGDKAKEIYDRLNSSVLGTNSYLIQSGAGFRELVNSQRGTLNMLKEMDLAAGGVSRMDQAAQKSQEWFDSLNASVQDGIDIQNLMAGASSGAASNIQALSISSQLAAQSAYTLTGAVQMAAVGSQAVAQGMVNTWAGMSQLAQQEALAKRAGLGDQSILGMQEALADRSGRAVPYDLGSGVMDANPNAWTYGTNPRNLDAGMAQQNPWGSNPYDLRAAWMAQNPAGGGPGSPYQMGRRTDVYLDNGQWGRAGRLQEDQRSRGNYT